MKKNLFFWTSASVVSGIFASTVAAQFKFNNVAGDGLWSTAGNWSGSRFPNAAGLVVQSVVANPAITELDVDATVGALTNNQGNARTWTITNRGISTLTFDNTLGPPNPWGNAAPSISALSSGGIVCAADVRLRGANLDIGTLRSNNPAAQITVSGAITAEVNAIITVRNGRRQTNLLGDIGLAGAGAIKLINLSSSTTDAADPNQLFIGGNLGTRVTDVTQGEGATSGMVVSGPNPSFHGAVNVLANSITVGPSGTLGDRNTITVAANARLILQNANALGGGAGLEVARLGLVSLSYAGTDKIDALSLDGGQTFAEPGSTWGAPGSGASHESPALSGTGFLQVMPAVQPTFAALR